MNYVFRNKTVTYVVCLLFFFADLKMSDIDDDYFVSSTPSDDGLESIKILC